RSSLLNEGDSNTFSKLSSSTLLAKECEVHEKTAKCMTANIICILYWRKALLFGIILNKQ
ncbi:MAG: hypothetical protein AAF740_14160, partial [Bacteroidota bacterium]